VLAVSTTLLLSACGGRSTTSNTTPRRPLVGPVPAGFSPTSFTAISDSDYWVLGTYRCKVRHCFAILRTTDNGKSFARVHVPPLPDSGVVPTLRFGDRLDGFAFVQGVGGVLYATHDGGTNWQRLSQGTLLGFATGGGNVYLITARCSVQRCSGYRFERSPLSTDSWSAASLPFSPDGSVIGLSAHGTNVWLLGSSAGNERTPHDTLARSSDGGRAFVTGTGPCSPDLGGDLEPTSADVVWAVCPTGMMAGAWRSTNGGVSFSPLRTPRLVNSARLAPASDTTAVIAANGAGATLARTTDGGTTWTPAGASATATYWPFIGFTDAQTGAAIVQTGNTPIQKLWRTTDAGLHWSDVAFGRN
jgi:hypothetical protein